MKELFGPLQADSLKDVFVEQIESLILSGRLEIGEKLPSERELAEQMKVSRQVIHEGLMELAFKGFVTMRPRAGTIINDYRYNGSLALLTSMLTFQGNDIDPKLLKSLLSMRILFEVETAGLAAKNRSMKDLSDLEAIVRVEQTAGNENIEELVDHDFRFHHHIAIASGNIIYPLLINSFRGIYTLFTRLFFTDITVRSVVIDYHRALVQAISDRDVDESRFIMRRLLDHGERTLFTILN